MQELGGGKDFLNRIQSPFSIKGDFGPGYCAQFKNLGSSKGSVERTGPKSAAPRCFLRLEAFEEQLPHQQMRRRKLM